METIVSRIAAKLIEELAPILVKQLSALLPVIVAAATKAITDQLRLKVDQGLPELVENIRTHVNQIPDIDIPVLSDVFDLTEWLKRL
jgi:hypothetical protein